MNNSDYTIYCSRCGAEMKASSRYCMKCGNLNYDHPENKNLQKIIGKPEDKQYVVGSGNSIFEGLQGENTVTQSIANNTGNQMLCFGFNILLYLIIILSNLIPIINSSGFALEPLVMSSFPIIAIVISGLFLYVFSLELLFMKANKRWWAALIPIYNLMILAEMAFNKKYLGLLVLIPYIGPIFLLVIFYKLGSKFKYNSLLTALFWFVMIPIIGFGNHPYDGRNFVENNDKNSSEKQYRRKKIFLIVVLFFMIFGIFLIVYGNIAKVEKTSSEISNAYYLYAAKRITSRTKEYIKNGNIDCDNASVLGENGIYYFYYSDASDEFDLLFRMSREPIEAYVKVIKTGDEFQYYISLTDGVKGFGEMAIDDVKLESIIDYPSLVLDFNSGIKCQSFYKQELAKKR